MGKRTGWDDLEKEFRIVILAEAGAGKSYEMENRAKYVKNSGRIAFFIRIEDIANGFEAAFEVGSADILVRWLASQEEAWFFLDSIDEARLENPKSFEKAIRLFASRINGARQRAHIFISSRPYAWRASSDHKLLERYLPFARPKSEATGDAENTNAVADEAAQPESALRVYLLDPLDENGIRTFAEHRKAPNIDLLLLDLQRKNLISVAGRPFDLDGIIEKWMRDQTLGGRLELLQHNIDLHLKEIDPARAQGQPLNRQKARSGARLLAASVILTGEPGIHVPDATSHEKGIDAESILNDWEPGEVQALLERGLFNDALYGLVRFRHREIRELLAAEWFYELLSRSTSRLAVETLFFREQYGHEVVTPRLRPVLNWLILFDDAVRHRAIGLVPEVAVEGGDAAHLPFAERQTILETIVERIVNSEDDRSARDNSAIARIAQTDLAADALRLIAKHQANEDAIFFLGRLVWQGGMSECVPALTLIATNPARGIYARIAATRAVMTCGTKNQKEECWQRMIQSQEEMPRRLFAEIIKTADSDAGSVALLLASLDKLETPERHEATGLNQALHGFVDRLPLHGEASGEYPMQQFVSGLNTALDRQPYIERGACHVSEEFGWLLGPAIHAVERLVSARSDSAFEPDALAIMNKMPAARFWQGDDFSEYKDRLHELVPTWPALNDALFWWSIEETRARLATEKSEQLTDDGPVQWRRYYWRFGPERFQDVLGFVEERTFEDNKLVALSLAFRLYPQSENPSDSLRDLKEAVQGRSVLEERLNALLEATVSPRALEYQKKEKSLLKKQEAREAERSQHRMQRIAHLKANPGLIRHPPGLNAGECSRDQYWLLGEIEGSGLRAANWEELRKEFGEEVARAYRDAAMAHWRNYTPGLRSEGCDTNSIPNSLPFALAGLEIEAREVAEFPNHLSSAEVQLALRYIVWELNGFPAWLETMYSNHPDLVLRAVLAELHWELENTEPEKSRRYILHDLVYYAPWMHSPLAAQLLNWMEMHEILNQDVLRYCIDIVTNGGADSKSLAKLAQEKIQTGGNVELLAAWYALWVDADAQDAIPALEAWLSSQRSEEASHAAQLFITKLMGQRRSAEFGYRYGSFLRAAYLKTLYVIMHRYIQAKDDIDRAGKGVYSPVLRDDAQDARDALRTQLSEIPGKQTYVVFSELAKDHPDPRYKPWMKRLALTRAEKDADLEPWSAQQVLEFNLHQARTPETHRQLFDLTVARLVDLRDWLERGNDSPYRTWQRAGAETEMRNLVAGWLNSHSSGRYSCAQENELANQQRPDIWTQTPCVTSPVPIELKLLDNGWSGPELCERLRNQLAGDYLREETAGCGVMLLIWQGRSAQSHWQIGESRVALSGLEEALRAYWGTVANNFPGVEAISVILIDLTAREMRSRG